MLNKLLSGNLDMTFEDNFYWMEYVSQRTW